MKLRALINLPQVNSLKFLLWEPQFQELSNWIWCKPLMERILVVDDEADCQTVLAMYLESQGYRVECANSGLEALSIFENAPQIW